MNEDCYHLGIKALIRDNVGKFLLLKVNVSQLVDHFDGDYWDIPGGRIKRGQSIEETIKKEIKEETGITTIKSIQPFTMVLSNIRIPFKDGSPDVGLILGIYTCDAGEVEKIILNEENIEYGWFNPKEAAKLLSYKFPKEFTDKLMELEHD